MKSGRQRVLPPEPAHDVERLPQPRLLPPELLAEELPQRRGDDGVGSGRRLVHDPVPGQDRVGEGPVVAERRGPAEERLELPGFEQRGDHRGPVGGAAPRGAGDRARQQRLHALDDPERRVVADLLHLGDPVDVGVADVGVADHRPDPVVDEGLHDGVDGVALEVGVGVDEGEDLAAGPADAFGHGASLAVVAAEVDGEHLGPAGLGFEDPFPGAVGRPVVDDDHLDQVLGVVDVEARFDRADDPVLLVEGGDDDRHGRAVLDVGDGPVEERADEPPHHVEADGDRVAGEERVLRQHG